MSAPGNNNIRWRLAGGERQARARDTKWSLLGTNPVANSPKVLLGPLASMALWLVGISALCWMTTWIHRPKHIQVVQLVAGYHSNLAVPHNVQGVRAAQTLSLLDGGTLNKSMVEIQEPSTLRKDTDLAKAIGESSSPYLIVNFMAHGGVDDQGPFLLPDNATTSQEPDNRIRVSKILEVMAALPEHQVKVLFFDAEQFEFLLPFGIIDNRFSQALIELEPAIARIPNLIVVNACSPGQSSWQAQDTGMTNFGNQLIRCLTGAAPDQNHDGQVTLWEVIEGLSREVPSWASLNRNAKQNILVLPKSRKPALLLADALVHQAGKQAYSPEPFARLESTVELRDVWERHRDLANAPLAPEQLCPELWNLYQRSLIRYEELLRAGDPVNALALRETHRQLESMISNSVRFPLDSFTNNFNLGLVSGLDPDEAGAAGASKLASELLIAPEGEVAAKISGYISRNLDSSADRMPPRIVLQKAVLEEAAKSPNPNPERIQLLISRLLVPGRLQPVESQGVMVYLRDRPNSQTNNSAIPSLIRARLKSEAASCGISETPPHVQSPNRGIVFYQERILEADAVRLSAQDRLLSSDSTMHTQALRDLARAEALYDKVVEDSARLSRAFNTHNHLMSVMPYYTLWLSKLGSPLNPTVDEFAESLSKPMTSAWESLHSAADAKTEAARRLLAGGDYAAQLRTFITLTETAAGQFEEVRRAHASQISSLSESDIFGEDLLIDDVLKVPTIDVDSRLRIIETQARSRAIKQSETVDAGTFRITHPEREREINASRAGALAMAMIGRTMFDDGTVLKEGNFESFDQVAERLRGLSLRASADLELITKAGQQIGTRFSLFAHSIPDLMAVVAKAPPNEKLALLIRADAFARIGSPTATPQTIDEEPGAQLRRCWLNNLLVFQAKRAWNEHLYAEGRESTPYYRVAMLNNFKDASIGPAPVGLDRVKALAESPGDITVSMMGIADNGERQKMNGPVHWTTEKTLELQFEAGSVPGGSIPGGVVQMEVSTGQEIQRPMALRGQRRHIDLPPMGETAAGKAISLNLESGFVERGQDQRAAIPAGVINSSVVVTCLYRGQRVELSVPVTLHATAPAVATSYPARGGATMSIRASKEAVADAGQAKGAVAIVVDCSGSMGPAGDDPGKISRVATALETVIARLPPGVSITVWVFGQGVGPARTVDNPEEHVVPVLGPTIMGADPGGVSARLARKFREGEIIPWNKSPLLSAMNKAATELLAQGGNRGHMTLIALTDGQDNRAAGDAKLNPDKLPIPGLVVKLFAGTGIQVNVIGFQAGAEDAAVRADFEPLSKLTPPGGFSSASHIGELVSQLENSMRREFRFELETPENLAVPTQPAGGFEAGTAGLTDKWIVPPISPGEYLVRAGSARGLLCLARLDAADCLLMGLERGKPPRRLGMADEMPGRPVARSGGWAAAIVQNKREKSGVGMLASLEKAWDPRETEVLLVKPGFAWWEFKPKGGAGAAARTWNEFGYPAPCWAVTSPAWPVSPATGGPAEATLEAWWTPEKIQPVEREFVRGNDYSRVTAISGKPILIDGQNCLVESVVVETRLVPVDPERWENTKCLVVRTRTAPPADGEEPKGLVLASLDGHALGGSQHVVHASAGRVASVFWPIDEAGAAQVASIQFRSLRRFKNDAKARGFHLRFEKTGTPDERDERPRPLIPFPRAPVSAPAVAP